MAKTEQGVKSLNNYINGEWVSSNTEQFQDVINPATGSAIAKVPLSSFSDVDEAVEVAKEAFKSWRNTPVPQRARVLFKFQQILSENHEELARLVTQENGKSYKEAYGEVLRGIECVEFAAGTPSLMMGENLSSISTNIDSQMFRYPLGVVAGISPFNFPMMVPFWMFPLAIACGNTFILKPSERTPILANTVAEMFTQAGLPEGVFNIVHGAHDVVNGLLTHEDIKAISFVGSEPVAKYVYQTAAENGKRVQALAGAKNHHIVMPDADKGTAIQNIISSAFGSAGQRCMACSAVIAVGDQGDEFVDQLTEEIHKIKMGDGMEDDVLLTPVIREESRANALKYIELGIDEGAQLIRDGRNDLQNFDEGYFLGPTVFDHVKPDMAIAKDEIFAPVLSVLRADNLGEALEIVNNSRFGNSATLFSNNAKDVRQFREDAEPGMLGVNIGVPAPMAFFPFSGTKNSFFGDLHANGKDGVNFYTQKKIITSRF